jgi:hypothetical protein
LCDKELLGVLGAIWIMTLVGSFLPSIASGVNPTKIFSLLNGHLFFGIEHVYFMVIELFSYYVAK